MNELESAQAQEVMESWFRQVTTPGSRLLSHGVVPKIEPKFVSCNFEEKTVTLSFDVLEWELNPQNVIHGGIIATAFDTTLGLLCHYFTKPQVVITVSLNTTYHKPIFMGDAFYIKAKMEFQGGSLCNITGDAWTQNNSVLAASATAVFKALREMQHNPLV
ncbi:thioesterase superfamily protein [Anaerotignum neopropionicum]|uniref:Acyl-coenzyme A thioesterase THEM4 n=1 Tax=Anaerotignum neopropionicum TaxID=36847 RepID=A0A136WIE3_9FIRM|nr:PaaI family thioesterase [Anaerotignum neopropionicum]KXL54166.1 thioesterase superfamily protein [Anaerotignum neopropionicum]KXL54291.1 thioesterase superfamily protein [Anaerotignum neopropionicum]